MREQSLISFARAIGIDSHVIPSHETIAALSIERAVSLDTLSSLDPSIVANLSHHFQEFLSLSWGARTTSPSAEATRNYVYDAADTDVVESWKTALETTRGMDPSIQVTVELTIAKTSICDSLKLPPHVKANYFIFETSLFRLLSAPLPTIDQHLFGGQPNGFALLIAEEGSLEISGPFLAVRSAPTGEFSKFTPSIPPPSSAMTDHALSLRNFALSSINWSNFSLPCTTPLHFIYYSHLGHDGTLVSLLCIKQLHALLIYCCSEAAFDNDGFTIRISGGEFSSEVRIPHTPEHLATIPPTILLATIYWMSTRDANIRIPIVRQLLAMQLSPHIPKPTQSLSNAIMHVHNEAKRQYALYVDSRVSEVFKTDLALITRIATHSQQVSSTIDATVKGVSDAALNLIQVVILTIIGALVSKNTSTAVFRWGMLAFAVYIVVFQWLWRGAATVSTLYNIHHDIMEQKRLYSVYLSIRRTPQLFAPYERRRNQACGCLALATVFHVFLAGVVIALSQVIPERLDHARSTATQAPTSTLTPTPLLLPQQPGVLLTEPPRLTSSPSSPSSP